ncbi:MAG TPA: sigma-70 family RNA polymerase sigma factor [Bryobacteraceae bacterium]|nr:sigma-70 family RNA polymerase sigma factor [Bryobacteraceae bacterium]
MDRNQTLALLRERIVAFAASRIERSSAEDLAQDVLMVLEAKYPNVTAIGELVPLALQILRFKMAALRRKQLRRGDAAAIPAEELQLADDRPGPEDWAAQQQMLDRLSASVRKLGERCRELLRLKLLGRSFAEIAEEMDAASVNTVYTWDLRCRKRLLELMGGRWDKP